MPILPDNIPTKSTNKIIWGGVLTLIIFFLISLLAIGAVLTKSNNGRKPTDNTEATKTNDWQTASEKLARQGKLQQFPTYVDLQKYLEKSAVNESGFYQLGLDSGRSWGGIDFGIGTMEAMPLAVDVSSPTPTKELADGLGSGPEYSPTNIQVAGVDEADIIKTDGQYIYAVTGKKAVIITAVPATEAKILSEINLDNPAQNIFINANRLVIFGYDYDLGQRKNFDFILPHTSFTYFKIYDTSDKTNPRLLKEYNFEGNYVDSRLIGDYVYFLTNKYPNIYTADIMPQVIVNDQLLCAAAEPDGRLCPNVYYFDIPHSHYELTTLAAININEVDREITQNTYLLGGTHTIYVSTNALYLTNSKYLDEYQLVMDITREIIEPQLPSDLQARIAKIKQTDNDVLTDYEKLGKINDIIQYYLATLPLAERNNLQKNLESEIKSRLQALADEREKTIIHKISISGDKMENVAKGEVPGTVLNQFSLDEDQDYLRIATTRNQTWSSWTEERQESYNNIYVLDADLQTVGKIERLAVGERIYAVRFMQNRAYLVTFQQIDPLFVIDLSEPTAPKVLGELKIPGYSNYLHPYDNDTLIGLGQDVIVNEFGGVRNVGVKLSLFDVSDVSNPQEIDNYIFTEPNTSSLAQNDHKAFLFSRDKELLVIPVSSWGRPRFNGATVFKVNKEGFEFRGTIDHARDNSAADNYYLPYNTEVKRSLYIGAELYTLSERYIKINNLADLASTNSIEISTDDGSGPIPYPEPIPLPRPLDAGTEIFF